MSRASATLRATVLLAVAGIAAVLVPGTSADSAPSYYLSLGDSLARGWQPGSDGHSHETDQGYVDDVAAALRKRHPGLRVVKLGCPGETTATMLRGGTCRYANHGELRQAEAFLQDHPGQVVAVTVNIGDNDVERCLAGGRFDSACVKAEMSGVRTRLPQIARRLRAAAGPDARIVGLTDYDQFLGYWLRGAAGRRFARRSVGVVVGLNRMADGIYSRAGIRVADATRAFATTNLSRMVHTRAHGLVPLAVQRICGWTWACGARFNDHANARGYSVLARVILAALR